MGGPGDLEVRRKNGGSPDGHLLPLPPGTLGDAHFSGDHRYRYWLERRWDDSLPRFTYVLLNPSAADRDRDDRTNGRLRGMTMANGGGSYELVNLFAVVDTHQVGLRYPSGIGETSATTDEWISRAVERADVLVVGWGDGNGTGTGASDRRAGVRRRASEVWPLVRHRRPLCFRRNTSGSPGHPLYLATGSPMTRYVPTAAYLTG